MSTPAGLDTVTVTGRYLAPDGTVAEGTVTFDPSPDIVAFAEQNLFLVGTVSAPLDATGAFSVELVCSDAAGANPSGYTYRVTENVSHQAFHSRTFQVLLLAADAGATVDLADIAPADPDEGDYVPVVGPPGPQGEPGPPGPQGEQGPAGADGTTVVTAGPGITAAEAGEGGYLISAKLDPAADNTLSVSDAGLYVPSTYGTGSALEASSGDVLIETDGWTTIPVNRVIYGSPDWSFDGSTGATIVPTTGFYFLSTSIRTNSQGSWSLTIQADGVALFEEWGALANIASFTASHVARLTAGQRLFVAAVGDAENSAVTLATLSIARAAGGTA